MARKKRRRFGGAGRTAAPGGVPTLAQIERVDEFRWRIPTTYKPGMRVPGLVFASDALIPKLIADKALEQVANVACLPGIVDYSLAMPDIHWGYGFPVGGVAATDMDGGVVSPGGIGYDINCGVRLIRTGLSELEVRERMDDLLDALFQGVPSGLGSNSRIRLSGRSMDRVLRSGARWAVQNGFGWEEDLAVIEEEGRLSGAETDAVSKRAKERGAGQLGTLGSGNHFVEVQVVDEVFDAEAAAAMGIERVGGVVVFIHTGSRGCGHQICQDYLDEFGRAPASREITLPDRQLACAPLDSDEGRRYLAAMACAANFAWANRQCITHCTREAFESVFRRGARDLGMELVYDVAHNIAKIEDHRVNGGRRRVCVHRKGATRAFPAGHAEIPAKYRHIGQPVFIPGDMGRYSFAAIGTERAMQETFGSTCHGAGRQLSRSAALKKLRGVNLIEQLGARGIGVRVRNPRLLAEEASAAYKDVADIVAITQGAGISRNVARLRAIGVIKG